MSNLLINESPLQVLPSLACEIGLNEALVLQQVHYRAGRSEDGWVQTTVAQWRRQFPFWGEATIKRAFKKLREKGLLVTEQALDPMDRTNRYRIDYERLPEKRVTRGSHRSARRDQVATSQNDPLSNRERTTTTETSPISPSREHPEFGQWIGRHHETFGDSVPKAGTQARARLAGSFAARRDEGLTLEDLLDVIEHVSVDPWHVDRGKHDATYLLRPSVSGRLVSAWRGRAVARAAAPAVDAKWSAAMAANEELQRREAEELSA